MSTQPPPQGPPPPEPHGPSGPSEPSPSPRVGAVIGGIVLGLVLAFVYMFLAFFAAYATDPNGSGAIWFVLLGAPAVLGVVLLAVPRTRRAGAGFVLGLAIGFIVLPAVCVSPNLL